MIYFLFLNHPKGEELYSVPHEREEMARRYFKNTDTIETEVSIKGKTYSAIVDYGVFSNLSNFDCFNCQDHCCADNPSKYEPQTRKFVLDNLEDYNSLTRNVDILMDLGYSIEEIKESILSDELMIPAEHVEEEISLCTCSFKPDNSSTICALHSLCLDKGMGTEGVLEYKPVICSLWPMEIFAEDDLSTLYITLPDDLTNGFVIEDYYSNACINREYGDSPQFRRMNPDGFDKDGYRPFIVSYADTIRYGLGERCYTDIRDSLLEDGLVSKQDFTSTSQQINKNF